MRAPLLPASLLVLAALAGCMGPEASPEEASPGKDEPGSDRPAMSPAAATPEGDDAPVNASSLRTLPLAVEGNVGTGFMACVLPLQVCPGVAPVAGDNGLVVGEQRGRVAGGELTLSWTAASPATEELSFGLMLMGSEGEACPSADLGTVQGASPLVIEAADPGRALCPDEVVHV